MEIVDREPEAGRSYSASLGEHASNPSEPRQVGVPLVLDDRTLTLATDEARIKAQFEMWLKQKAQEAIQDAMRRGDPDEADLLRSVYMGDLATGAYGWDGRHTRSARKDWAGNIYLLYLMLRRCHPKIKLEEVYQVMEDYPRQCGDAMRAAQGNWPSVLAKEKRRTERERRKATEINGSPEAGPPEPQTMDQ